jgi:hypothetical protein
VVQALIPNDANLNWCKAMGLKREPIKVPVIKTDGTKGDDKVAPFITFRLNNIVNKPQLVEVGQKIFEEVGRQQIEGSFSTKEMRVCEVDKKGKVTNAIPAMQMRIGTPVDIDINQGDMRGP